MKKKSVQSNQNSCCVAELIWIDLRLIRAHEADLIYCFKYTLISKE